MTHKSGAGMDSPIDVRKFKPRRNSTNTLHSRAEEFIYWKSLTRTETTADAYRAAIKRFETWVTANGVREITPRAIFRYFVTRCQPGRGRISAGRDRNILCVFFAWCARMGYMAVNPVAALPPSAFPTAGRRHKTFTLEEYDRLKRVAVGSEWYYAIVCGWNTALRISDVSLMRWSDVDWDSKSIRILPRKTQRTGKLAVIPIMPELEEILRLREVARIGSEQHVSEELAILYMRDRGVTLSKQFSILLAKAGITGKTFHALRHTALEKWMNHPNADHITVGDMSGHSNLSSLARYCQPSLDKKKLIMGIDNQHQTEKISQ